MPSYSSEQLKKDLEAVFKNSLDTISNPAKAIQEQAAALQKFQEQVTKQFGETRTLLDRAKDFLKDPKKEGIRIVKDAVSAMDKFFANFFKLLTKDVGKLLKDLVKELLSKIGTTFDTLLKKGIQNLSKVLTSIGTRIDKNATGLQSFIRKNLGTIVTGLNRTLSNWGKGLGLPKAISNIAVMSKSIGQSSKALAALKDIPKGMSSLVGFVKLVGKAAPLISSFVDLYWKNDVTNRLKQQERQIKADSTISDKQFAAIISRLNRIESSLKGSTELGLISRNSTQILSEVRGLKTSANQGLSNDQSIKSSLNNLSSRLSSPQQQKDYSSQLAAISSALGVINTKVSTPPPSSSSAIDYNKVTQAAQQALSSFKVTIPDDVARKSDLSPLATKTDVQSIPSKVEKPTPIDYSKILQQVNQALSSFKPNIEIPADVARKSDLSPLATRADVQAIPGKIKEPTPIDYNKILQQTNQALSTFKPTVNLPSDLARKSDFVDVAKKTDLTSAIANLGNVITNNVRNIVNNNNSTIINEMAPALNPSTIINPIKQHIDSQVSQPLQTTMDVLNVNDLKKGLQVNAEALIKTAGFQQFGAAGAGASPVTNLLGLASAIAAPIFFRAGFQKLGGQYDVSVMHPEKGKVKIDDALSASLWTFKQVDERLGLPNNQQIKQADGTTVQAKTRNIQDAVETINATAVTNSQDLEVIERYVHAIAQDMQKMMQIVLQVREDVDVLIDDSGCKYEEVKRSHPSHLKLTAPGAQSSLLNLFQQGRIHYVGKVWKGNADKHQILERIGLDTQIAAMSNKFEIKDVNNIELPLDKSSARKGKQADDETWKIFVSTMEEPPEIYGVKGNPMPEIKEIKTGTVREVPKPTNPSKKLGQ